MGTEDLSASARCLLILSWFACARARTRVCVHMCAHVCGGAQAGEHVYVTQRLEDFDYPTSGTVSQWPGTHWLASKSQDSSVSLFPTQDL